LAERVGLTQGASTRLKVREARDADALLFNDLRCHAANIITIHRTICGD